MDLRIRSGEKQHRRSMDFFFLFFSLLRACYPAGNDDAGDFDDHEGAGGVEVGGWFIEEEHDGVVDDVGVDGDTAAFATGDATVALVADDQRREKLRGERGVVGDQRREKFEGERKKIWCKQFHRILIILNHLIF